MFTIEGSEVVKYIYDTEYQQFSGESWAEAEKKFMDWMVANTNYRSLTAYAKHHGFHTVYETANSKRYVANGIIWYKIDEYYNLTRINSGDVDYGW